MPARTVNSGMTQFEPSEPAEPGQGPSDRELLRRYAEENSSEAFAQIVARYVDLVYSSARRQLRDAHLAEDATQAVFLLLTRKAAGLRREAVLAGWLMAAVTYHCRNLRRAEARRVRREQRLAEMAHPDSTGGGGDNPGGAA